MHRHLHAWLVTAILYLRKICLIMSENNSTVAHEDNVYVNKISFVSPDLYFIRFMKHDTMKYDKIS